MNLLKALRPRRTHESVTVFRLAGGNEDNDLWVVDRGNPRDGSIVCSTWELTTEHRAAIAAGANIELRVWGGQPPVAILLTDVQLGKPPNPEVPDA